MVEERIGYRYAKSLFGLAEEKGLLEKTQTDMAMIQEITSGSRELRLLLQSPIVNGSKKGQILKEIFGSHYQSELVSMFVDLISRKGRERYLPQIADAFIKLYDESKGIVRGTLTSSVPLSTEQADEIRQMLEKKMGKTFVIEEEVNPELIGGFTLKIGDDLYDGSVASSLRKLKKSLLQAN